MPLNYPNIETAYEAGFETGKRWDAKWKPGGPYVPMKGPGDDQKWIEYCDESLRQNEAWLRGWSDGLAEKRKAEKS